MKSRYFLYQLRSLPLLPIIYFQAKKLKKNFPMLPPAENPEGTVQVESGRELSVFFVGESAFAGVGVNVHENSFAGHFAKALSNRENASVHWKVCAKSGYNVHKVRTRVLPKITETRCDLLVIGIGANDAFELVTPKKFSENIQIFIDDLRAKFPQTPIFFVQLPPLEAFPALTKEMRYVLGGRKDFLAEALKEQITKNSGVYFASDKLSAEEWLSKLGPHATFASLYLAMAYTLRN